MVRISRFNLSERALVKLSQLLFEVVGRTSSRAQFENTIVDLMSPIERLTIAKRIAIMYLILRNIDQPTICYVLKVSSGTVVKYRLLMEKSDGIVPTLKKMVSTDEVKIVLEELFSALFAPGTPHINWSAAWKRRLELQRKREEGI